MPWASSSSFSCERPQPPPPCPQRCGGHPLLQRPLGCSPFRPPICTHVCGRARPARGPSRPRWGSHQSPESQPEAAWPPCSQTPAHHLYGQGRKFQGNFSHIPVWAWLCCRGRFTSPSLSPHAPTSAPRPRPPRVRRRLLPRKMLACQSSRIPVGRALPALLAAGAAVLQMRTMRPGDNSEAPPPEPRGRLPPRRAHPRRGACKFAGAAGRAERDSPRSPSSRAGDGGCGRRVAALGYDAPRAALREMLQPRQRHPPSPGANRECRGGGGRSSRRVRTWGWGRGREKEDTKHPLSAPLPFPPALLQQRRLSREGHLEREGEKGNGERGAGVAGGRRRVREATSQPAHLEPLPALGCVCRTLLHPQLGSAQGRGQAGTKEAGWGVQPHTGRKAGEGRKRRADLRAGAGVGAPLVSGAGLTFAVLIYPAKHPKHAAGQVAPSGCAP